MMPFRNKPIIDVQTRNLSFLQTAKDLKILGIKNNVFFLQLFDPALQGIDPHNPHLPEEIQMRIINECLINPWYFLREVVRIPEQGGSGIPYQLNSLIAMIKDRASNVFVAGIIGRQAYAFLGWGQKIPRYSLSLMDAVMKVTFPAISRLQNNKDFVKKYKGIGEAKAINIIAALELGRRRQETTPLERIAIRSSKDAFLVLNPLLADLPHEEFWILLCNRAGKVIHKHSIGRGGVTSVVVDARLVIKYALEHLASSIILCHNHPSGNLKPSSEDIKLTQRVKDAAALFEIVISDHLIIGDNNYYSFADEGIL